MACQCYGTSHPEPPPCDVSLSGYGMRNQFSNIFIHYIVGNGVDKSISVTTLYVCPADDKKAIGSVEILNTHLNASEENTDLLEVMITKEQRNSRAMWRML